MRRTSGRPSIPQLTIELDGSTTSASRIAGGMTRLDH
jgi:hypothetical protein